jgi:Protein of unknown function (DUF1552)
MINHSRRELILKLGAWPLLWPLLRASPARAAPSTQPKRVLVFCSTNGPISVVGPTVGTENNFQLHEWWSPLERHKAQGTFFVGCDQAGIPFGESDWDCGHNPGSMGALTATASEKTHFATGPSIDAFIGAELQRAGVVTPKRSLLWGVGGEIGNKGPWFEAAQKPATVQQNPYAALAQLVPGLQSAVPGAPPVDPRLLRRRLALSTAYKDCKELTGSLGPEGRRLLDFHCSNVDALEKNVAKSIENAMSAPSTVNCTAPAKPNTTLPANANFGAPDSYDEALKAYADMAALAFACDVTRVIGISFGGGAARFAIPGKYGVPSAAQADSGDSGPQQHAWTHTYNDGPDKRAALKGFYNWYSSQVAMFIDTLKSTLDASGRPLMDSTLVLWTSELGSEGNGSLNPHPNSNIPVLLFGDSLGAYKTNRMYKGTGGPSSALVLHKLFVSIAQHAGLTGVNAFGNQGQGALDWLKG